MKRRIANKIVFSSYYYWDVWSSPNGKHFIDVPHSGKHWYLWLKACDTLGGAALSIKENVIEQMNEVIDKVIKKQKEAEHDI